MNEDHTQDLPVCDDELVEFDVPTEFGPLPAPVTAEELAEEASVDAEPATVEVRRRAGVAALVGVLAGAVATAYLARAVDTGSAMDWAVCALMALVAVAHLAALLDARTPLLVADDLGVRLRLGRSWAGLTWGSLRRVQVTAPGHLVAVLVCLGAVEEPEVPELLEQPGGLPLTLDDLIDLALTLDSPDAVSNLTKRP